MRTNKGGLPERTQLLALAVALFGAITALRLSQDTPGFGYLLLLDIPVALVAIVSGLRAGLIAATVALIIFAMTDRAAPIEAGGMEVHTNAVGYFSRALVFYLLGGCLGLYSDRFRTSEQANRRLAAIIQQTEDSVLVKDETGIITEWNRSAERMYGYTAEEAVGKPALMLIPADRVGEEEEMLRRVFRGESVQQFETIRVGRTGDPIDVSLTVSPIRDGHGSIVAAATIARDISERKRFEGQLQYLADHDALTGLFNRRRFEEELDRELARAQRYGSTGAVLAADLDHFKYVNDTLGHSAGDQLITTAGEILKGRLRTTDVLGRLGGDEFAVILPNVNQAEAEKVAASLVGSIRMHAGVTLGDGDRRTTMSVGIAPFSGESELTAENLLMEADIAMYDAKEAGRDRAVVYSAENRHERMHLRLTWVDRVRSALEDERFVLHAQPILGLNGDPIPRHELLLRMVAEGGELVTPGVFLYAAERMDLIEEIDRWVMRKAISMLAAEQRAGNDICLEVNLSAKSVAKPGFAAWIGDELATAGAEGRGLCVEITETAAIVNVERAKRFAMDLHDMGCEFALDDFGAGFASFYYLKNLVFDYLKIDGEFITGLATGETDQLVVKSLVEIARGLGERTIAEFVVNGEILELLREYGVDYAQGYYVGEPRPVEEIDLAHPAVVPT